jgi:hypothetical protein
MGKRDELIMQDGLEDIHMCEIGIFFEKENVRDGKALNMN